MTVTIKFISPDTEDQVVEDAIRWRDSADGVWIDVLAYDEEGVRQSVKRVRAADVARIDLS